MNRSVRFIVGLGNPESQYRGTPHNLGRDLVESVATRKSLKWKRGTSFEWTDSDPSFVRLKNYMNDSGHSLQELITQFHVSPSEILILVDDFDLVLGKIRIRKQGSPGSHRGLQSICQTIQTEQFPRLRLGIGPLPLNEDPAEFVLKPFSQENKKVLDEVLATSTAAIDLILSEGLEKAMNRYNT